MFFFVFKALSVLSGTTIADQNTVIQGSLTVGLNFPFGLTMYGVMGNESLIIADLSAQQVLDMKNVDSNDTTVSVLARNWTGGDLYVSDNRNFRVVLFSSMKIGNPLPKVVAGVTGRAGSAPNQFSAPMGITLDGQKNLYVADFFNSRIMLWRPNATFGILIIGNGTNGSDSMSLNQPSGIFLDQDNSLLYVADTNNHRIQVFHLTGSPPYNGTTVAGGNGPGSDSHQLNTPTDVWVSKKTGAIYIAEYGNNRIQRWNKGASTGVTLAGSPNGTSGIDSTHLYHPRSLVINADETRMYVSDSLNKRIQRFDLI
jgi:sugar lactone lactonase YvrE